MPRRPNNNVSAGILLFRKNRVGDCEVFLAHPGGPFWAQRDAGAWTIPKGVPHEGEELFAAARREFEEETGIAIEGRFIPLGSVRQKAGKTVHGWACEGDADPETIRSNSMPFEWPPRSGQWITVPEIDRCSWFDLATGRAKINAAQQTFLDRLERLLAGDDAHENGNPFAT